ncbi:MAG: hypothetical protein M1838_004969 [Thelocarpon superellum]|nr:MAG: hypothetical protein M1838_004969 [Thelocarpon superellum]
MAASIPRPARSSRGPPTAALPPLPVSKSRRPMNTTSSTTPSTDAAPSMLPDTRSPRAASTSHLPTLTPSRIATPDAGALSKLPSLDTNTKSTRPGVPTPGKTLHRTISTSAFPHTSAGTSRIASLPSSPLSAGVGSRSVAPMLEASRSQRDADKASPSSSAGPPRLKRSKTSGSNMSHSFTASRTPSLLNGSGEGKAISLSVGGRASDGLLSITSPAESRTSSAQGSSSTSATTFDDCGEAVVPSRAGGDEAEAEAEEKRDSKSKEGKGNVIVSVRVRPDASNEHGRTEGEWMVDGRRSLVAYRGREGGDYYYDNVFATHDQNAKVYDASAKRLVRRVMEGYHGTVFAYGMTGTGKTFSMQGTATSPGVIPLAITDIFSYIRETPHREFLLRVSYLEIYNEKIHDLLSTPAGPGLGGMGGGQQEEIKLREDSKRGVYASPLKEEIVQSPTQLLRVIARGDHARRTSSTQYNARSSRSHAVVQIVVESRERMPGSGSMQDSKRAAMVPGGVRVSTLSLIDLAGSERAAESKERRTEGAHINKSLLTLGTVIARLSGDKDKNGNPTDKDGKHLPYRDSKLTRLLQPALSGNSLVSILCTIQIGSAGSAAAANSHTGETLNTLKFAARAKNNIVSHAKKAEEALGSGGGDAGSRVLLERYRMEILELRGELEGQAKARQVDEDKEKEKEAEARHEEQMLEIQLARTALKERIEHLNRLILSSKSTGVNSSSTFAGLGPNSRVTSASGHGSALSQRSSAAASTVGRGAGGVSRSTSVASASTVGQRPRASAGGPDGEADADETRSVSDDSMGEFGDGTASLSAQVRALQADLADRNRYISTLEKRLLQARRSSHSRTSLGFSPQKMHGVFWEDDGVDSLVKEKDAEIEELKSRLDDKERMLTALRSAARKRDVADLMSEAPTERRTSGGRDVRRSAEPEPESEPGRAVASPPRSPPAHAHERSQGVDEMSRMLDEMIQSRMEKTPVVKRRAGSQQLGGPRLTDTVPALGSAVDANEFPRPPASMPIPAS